jgi:O-acetyl-ADP-ribose deacetylase (regulator of RNase III)
MLIDCYINSLDLAKVYDLHSIAFPAISTGVYGYPKEEAATIAILTVTEWLKDNSDYDMSVIFSCFDNQMYDIYLNTMNNL